MFRFRFCFQQRGSFSVPTFSSFQFRHDRDYGRDTFVQWCQTVTVFSFIAFVPIRMIASEFDVSKERMHLLLSVFFAGYSANPRSRWKRLCSIKRYRSPAIPSASYRFNLNRYKNDSLPTCCSDPDLSNFSLKKLNIAKGQLLSKLAITKKEKKERKGKVKCTACQKDCNTLKTKLRVKQKKKRKEILNPNSA